MNINLYTQSKKYKYSGNLIFLFDLMRIFPPLL